MDYEQRIQSVLNYIETHVQEDIRCESLVALAGFSKSHFLRVFEAYTGFTVMSYVRGRKLDLAAERLRNSNDKIAEIAYDYGFESHDVFGRAFKRVYGITPENYRRGRFLLPTFHAVQLAQQDYRRSACRRRRGSAWRPALDPDEGKPEYNRQESNGGTTAQPSHEYFCVRPGNNGKHLRMDLVFAGYPS